MKKTVGMDLRAIQFFNRLIGLSFTHAHPSYVKLLKDVPEVNSVHWMGDELYITQSIDVEWEDFALAVLSRLVAEDHPDLPQKILSSLVESIEKEDVRIGA